MIRRALLAIALSLALGVAALTWAAPARAQERIPPLPDGEGKALVMAQCSICHDLLKVRQQRLIPSVWDGVLDQMKEYGAPFTEEQRKQIFAYLTKYLGQEP